MICWDLLFRNLEWRWNHVLCTGFFTRIIVVVVETVPNKICVQHWNRYTRKQNICSANYVHTFHYVIECTVKRNTLKFLKGLEILGRSTHHGNIPTCVYNFDPLKPHFFIVKLGFTGVYIIFLFLLKNIDSGYSLEPPRWGDSNEYLHIWNPNLTDKNTTKQNNNNNNTKNVQMKKKKNRMCF